MGGGLGQAGSSGSSEGGNRTRFSSGFSGSPALEGRLSFWQITSPRMRLGRGDSRPERQNIGAHEHPENQQCYERALPRAASRRESLASSAQQRPWSEGTHQGTHQIRCHKPSTVHMSPKAARPGPNSRTQASPALTASPLCPVVLAQTPGTRSTKRTATEGPVLDSRKQKLSHHCC